MKYLFIALIFLILIGCSAEKNETEEFISEKDIELDLTNSKSKDFGMGGSIESTDSDNDGENDVVSYSSGKVKIDDNLYMKKNIEYTLTDEGYEGEINIEFEGEGEYEHIEIFPKSFAEHIDDIEFSIEPDEIINDDPAARWIVKTIKGKISTITAKAQNKGTASGISAGFDAGVTESINQVGNYFGGRKYDFSKIGKEAIKEGKKAGTASASDVILDNLGDFIFISDLTQCSREKDEFMDLCVLKVMNLHPKYFENENCNDIFGHVNEGWVASCKALMKRDMKECMTLKTIYGNQGSIVDPATKRWSRCITVVVMAHCPDTTDVECIQKVALEYKSEVLCNTIKDPEKRKLCLEGIGIKIGGQEEEKKSEETTPNLNDKDPQNEIEDEFIVSEEEKEEEDIPLALEKIMEANYITMQFCGFSERRIDDNGNQEIKEETQCVNFNTDVPLVWNGRLFEAKEEEDVTDSFGQVAHVTDTIEGSISEDGKKIVRLTAFWENDRAPYDHRYYSVEISEVDFPEDRLSSTERKIKIEGPEVKYHVSDPESYQLQTNLEGKRWEYHNMESIDYDDAEHPPILKINFEKRTNWYTE